MLSLLKIDDLTITYPRANGEKYIAANCVNMSAEDGEITVLMGNSGCGKTSVLKTIAGLIPMESGTIMLNGIEISKLETKERNIAMVSQHIALYPSMTVFDNIAMPLRAMRTPAAEIERRVKDTAKLLEIDWLLTRKPGQLSGGQQQRVAIGRAIVKRPELYLFDEPFSGLDSELREKMQDELMSLRNILDAPIVFVTHDRREAMILADKLIVMIDGTIRQQGKPMDVYHNPVDADVRALICEE